MYLTPKKVTEIATRFVDQFADDANLFLGPGPINRIIHEIDPEQAPSPALPKPIKDAIDKLSKKKLNRLPPIAMRGGYIYARAVDGSVDLKNSLRRVTKDPKAHHNGNGNGNGANGHHVRHRIVWTQQEKDILVDMVVENWTKEPHYGISLGVINEAQKKILDEHRRRHLVNVQGAEDVYTRAVAEVKSIVATAGLTKTAQESGRVVVTTVPYDVRKVLADVPLPTLAAVLAERQMHMQVAFYERAGIPVESKAPTGNAALIEAGVDAEHIDAALPKIQVIGLRGHEHASFREQLAKLPLNIVKSVDPSAKLDPELVDKHLDMLLLKKDGLPPEWRELATALYPASKRCHNFNMAQCVVDAKTVAGQWMTKNKDAYEIWRRKHSI